MKNIIFFSLALAISFSYAQDDSKLRAIKNELESIHGVKVASLQNIYPEKSELKKVVSDIGIAQNSAKFVRVNAITVYGKLAEVDYHNGLSLADQEFYLDLTSQPKFMNDEILRSALYRSLANTGAYEALSMLDELLGKEKEVYLKQQILEAAANALSEQVTPQLAGDMVYGSLGDINPLLKVPYYKRQDAEWGDLVKRYSEQTKKWFHSLASKDQKDPVVLGIYGELKHDFDQALRAPGSVDDAVVEKVTVKNSNNKPDQEIKPKKDEGRRPQSVEENQVVEQDEGSNLARYALLLILLGVIVFAVRKFILKK
jgi:hypothetical protein